MKKFVLFISATILSSFFLNFICYSGLSQKDTRIEDFFLEFLKNYNDKSIDKQRLLYLINQCIYLVDPLEKRKIDLINKIDASVLNFNEDIKLSIIVDDTCEAGINNFLDYICNQKTNFNYEVICLVNELNNQKYKSYKVKYPNLTLIGNCSDINSQVFNSNSNFLLYLSSRDVLAPFMLQRLIDFNSLVHEDVVAFSNIITVDNRFPNLILHDKFYTSFKMGKTSFGVIDFIDEDQQQFIWGFKNGQRLFSSSCFLECGGFVGFSEDYYFNLTLCMLFKGFDFCVFTNGFFYKYCCSHDWYSDIFNVNQNRQVDLMVNNFSEMLDDNSNKYIGNISRLCDLPWRNQKILKNITLAYQYEYKKDYERAYHCYCDSIKNGSDHIKIYLKCIRSFLLINNLEDDFYIKSIFNNVLCLAGLVKK